MENIGGGRIVDNNNVVELPPQPTEVFDVVPSVKHARLSEEPRSKNAPLVQQVGHRVRVLSKQTHTHKRVTLANMNTHGFFLF